ncbi:S-phase kinase-associated protein 2 [Biomphalaria pfeifferi]|uniref:S-phase kinase-associated protein 2 n=1 Tax=Biomphalaria pfeifferi TaxID=112525 RepID=A0AAD8FNY9_BIOPF|nr:S-phase kinase-associated protein 2 [Biomphalaria pfeifferi]
MEEERKQSNLNKELSKYRNRNKRTSDVFDDAYDNNNQNRPPCDDSRQCSKRTKRDDPCVGSSFQMGPPSIKSESTDEHVTPNTFVSVNSSLASLGAPRILLINQQVNADHQQQPRHEASIYHHLLRTPPSIKNNRVYLRRNNDEEYRGFDRFARVSDEIILRIFHHLPRHMMCTCALVCRRWARIVCDVSLWRRMDMGGRPLKVGILKILLERGVEVLRLNRSEVMGDFSSTVQGAPDPRRSPLSEERMYRLQLLDMSMANVKTSLVESMLKFCPNLKKISLENIPVTEQLLINLAVNSPYLEVLNLCMCVGTTAKGLECIFENCTNLIQLNIAWTYMSEEEIKTICQIMPSQMKALDISGNREKLSDQDVELLCQRCPYMQDLDLSDSTEITNLTIDNIAQHLKKLQKISFSRCYSLSPTYVSHLCELRDLKVINVFGMMRDTSLNVLEQNMKRYRVNKEPFSCIARPTPSNCKKIFMWNVSPRHGPCL